MVTKTPSGSLKLWVTWVWKLARVRINSGYVPASKGLLASDPRLQIACLTEQCMWFLQKVCIQTVKDSSNMEDALTV